MEVADNIDAGPWYIDAWAVHDGRVFASRRRSNSIDADATVFMSVPDLEAVPVGRISTALRATRSGFQEGLRDEVGAEIPFETLAQVRDLVRRAYLAAGLGPGAPGALAGPLPRPDEIGPGPGAAYLESPPQFVDLTYDGTRVSGPFPPEADDAVRRLALATLLEWDLYLEDEDPEEIRGVLGWINALQRSGVMADDHVLGRRDLYELVHFAQHFGAPALARALSTVLERLSYGWQSYWPADLPGAYWSRLHLSAVPLPRIGTWDTRMRRLVELYIQPLADRRFWEARPTMADLAPLLLVVSARGAARHWRLPGEPSSVEVAFEAAMPSLSWVEQPEAAEVALAQFIDNCLEGPTTTGPSGAPQPSPQPEPAGSGGGARAQAVSQALRVQA